MITVLKPGPAVDELDAGLEPVPCIDAHHRPGLVVLVGVSPADPHRQVEVAVDLVAVDVAAVADEPVVRRAPEVSADTTSDADVFASACSPRAAGEIAKSVDGKNGSFVER